MDHQTGVTNKVIILYILSQLDSLTFPRLSDTVLGTALMDYFQFKASFDALRADNWLTVSVRKGETERDADGRPVERCALTPRGEEALRTLRTGIPQHVTDFLASETGRWSAEHRNRRAAQAESLPDPDGGWRVSLRLHDGTGETMLLQLRLPDRKTASAVCDRFREDPAGFHSLLLRRLTGPGS